MSPTPTVRRVLMVLAVLLLLGLAWTGLSGGLRQLRQAQGVGQAMQTWSQLVYGLLSVAAILTTFRARRLAWPVRVLWAGSLTVAAGLAPVVWGETGWANGLLAAVAGLLIAFGIIWLLRTGASRPDPRLAAGGRGGGG